MTGAHGLRVWHAAREFSETVAGLASEFPRGAPPHLRGQIVSAARSVSASIAEGIGRGTPGEKLYYLRVARGSLEETQSDLRSCINKSLITRRQFYDAWNRAIVIGRMLRALIAKVEADDA